MKIKCPRPEEKSQQKSWEKSLFQKPIKLEYATRYLEHFNKTSKKLQTFRYMLRVPSFVMVSLFSKNWKGKWLKCIDYMKQKYQS